MTPDGLLRSNYPRTALPHRLPSLSSGMRSMRCGQTNQLTFAQLRRRDFRGSASQISAVERSSRLPTDDGVLGAWNLPRLKGARVCRNPVQYAMALCRTALESRKRHLGSGFNAYASPPEGNTDTSGMDTRLCKSRFAGSWFATAPSSRFLGMAGTQPPSNTISNCTKTVYAVTHVGEKAWN
jgi:hypothetical protein